MVVERAWMSGFEWAGKFGIEFQVARFDFGQNEGNFQVVWIVGEVRDVKSEH